MNFLFLQVATDSLNTSIDTLQQAEKTGFLDILGRMGVTGIAIILITFILSCIAVYIFISKFLAIKKAGQIDDRFMASIKDNIANGNIQSAKDLCLRTNTPVARMVEKGILRLGKPLKDIQTSIENVGNLEIYRMEKGVNLLATISGVAPMLGFLGTVTGMISAFYKLSQAGNNINPGMLAGGIYEAMLTTAIGLAVGIFAFMAYNLLVSMIQNVVHQMENATVDFIDLLQEPTK